ncbi:hypothetical protein [Nocardia sp. NPDC052566]|uniref:DUF6630 family protein n=1 Tax=Nocardia sp. NPDC052566 TaxID=3364330 RepID=UPI0037CC2A82
MSFDRACRVNVGLREPNVAFEKEDWAVGVDRGRLLVIAEHVAPGVPAIAAAVRSAPDDKSAMTELAWGLRGAGLAAYIDWAEDPEDVQEALNSLRSRPGAMSWDWWDDEDCEDCDEAEVIERFLGLAGDHSRRYGAILFEIEQGGDGYLVGFMEEGSVGMLVDNRSLRVVATGWQNRA